MPETNCVWRIVFFRTLEEKVPSIGKFEVPGLAGFQWLEKSVAAQALEGFAEGRDGEGIGLNFCKAARSARPAFPIRVHSRLNDPRSFLVSIGGGKSKSLYGASSRTFPAQAKIIQNGPWLCPSSMRPGVRM